jgi:hypothetical protein
MARTASIFFVTIGLLAMTSGACAAQRVAWLWDGAALPPWSSPHAAVLVENVLLTGTEVRTRPRLGPWPLPGSTRVTPVVHVEVSTVNAPRPGTQARDAIAQAVMRAAGASTSGWVQLDMEARPAQRDFYLALVHQLRADLPRHLQLSVTALAWWCRSPAWLDGLAADEVVPMAFRMGRDSAALRAIWLDEPARLHPKCRSQALGVATVEPLPQEVTQRYGKVYVFDRRAWHDATRQPQQQRAPKP